MNTFKTGDLLLFNDQTAGAFGAFTKMIKWGTHSNYSHTAIVIRDPTFTNPPLKGLYVLESSCERFRDAEDNKFKFAYFI